MRTGEGKVNIFWFRRDLRVADNCGLYNALVSLRPVLPIFIFDTDILDRLEDTKDKRVEFIHNAVREVHEELVKFGSNLLALHGKPLNLFKELVKKYNIQSVYTNHDYEPDAVNRDNTISDFLNSSGIEFKTYKDQVIFEKDEVIKPDGSPYTVFTSYSKRWKAVIKKSGYQRFPSEKHANNFYKTEPFRIPPLGELGFKKSEAEFPEKEIRQNIIREYHKARDYPALNGTSRLGAHLRFGTVSVRELVKKALKLNEKWLDELIWREFFMMILYHFPHIVTKSFRSAYDNIKWRNNEEEFKAWCSGKTGYPIVDAGMRELNQTGYMHNRVRMITASFLTKHFLIDWRWGERYFADKLLDYELASNNGNWQWVAGSGCDAAPYFRIFNPITQAKRFDPELAYIDRWVPEYNSPEYTKPIVEHSFARNRAIEAYKLALRKLN